MSRKIAWWDSPVDVPRVIATDLDGTLLRGDSTLSRRTRAALREVRAAGVRVVAATARPYRVLDELFGDDPLIDVAICGNGSVRYDMATHRVAITHPLAEPVLRHVVETISANVAGAGFAVETGHRVLFEPGYRYRPTLDNDRVLVDTCEELFGEASVKLMVWLPDGDPDAAWTMLSPMLSGVIECTWSAERAPLEIAASGVSKAAALDVLCRSWNVGPAEVIAFGDAVNDLAMLTWAGTSYAVANADPAVLAVASHRTASNDEDGVAAVLESIL